MALLAKIFQSRKSKTPTTKWYTQESNNKWSEPEFKASQVRLVLYRDQDFKGRSLLFDSKAVHLASEQNERTKTCAPRNQATSSLDESGNNGPPVPKYSFSRPGSDTKMLEEMAFGAVGMAYRGSTLKVHTIRTPPQLMVTKVFVPSKNRSRESGVEGESLDYSLNCSSTELAMPQKIALNPSEKNPSIAQSVPMDVPSPTQRTSYNAETEPEDSGFSTSGASSLSSMNTSMTRSSSSSSINSNSYNSMTRRWRRSQQTSLEHSWVKRQSDEGVYEQPIPSAKRPAKVGMAVVISLHENNEVTARQFQNFFFSHITLIEGHVNKLKAGVEKAMMNRKQFVHLMVEALRSFRQLIVDLYLTPRLQEPVWLDMMCYTTHRVALCQRFLREFMTVVTKYDTKQTKFFLSTLITGVLTNHLAWVPTVTPAGATPARSYLDKHTAKWLDAVAKSHPYNPLWAQLGDLYGALGFPLRLTRTVVVGKKADMVNKFLYILSYFIRCSEVLERFQQPNEFDKTDPAMMEWAAMQKIQTEVGSQCSSDEKHLTQALSQSSTNFCVQCQANRSSDPLSANVFRSPALWTNSPVSKFIQSKAGSPLPLSETVPPLSKRSSAIDDDTKVEDPGGGGGSPLPSLVKETPQVDQVEVLELIPLDQPTDQGSAPVQKELDDNTQTVKDNDEQTSPQTEPTQQGFESNAKVDSETEKPVCRMSPTFVKEEPEMIRIRHVGRQASISPSISPLRVSPQKSLPDQPALPSSDICDTIPILTPTEGATSADDTTKSNCDSNQGTLIENPDLEESPGHSAKTEYAHDSGMYDIVVPPESTAKPMDEECASTDRDSGWSDCQASESEETSRSEVKQAMSALKIYRVPPVFEHSSSMFDEYFTDDVQTELEPAPESIPTVDNTGVKITRNPSIKSSTTNSDRYKRLASIEGSNSLFDEYMNLPCPDISRISEASLMSVSSLGTDDTSMFDEYFSTESPKSEDSNGPSMEYQSTEEGASNCQSNYIHLADRRKATRPDCLVMNPTKKDSDVTPRPRQLSGQSTATITPGRTRSVTPSELSRRRHASSLSNASSIEADFFLSLKEVDMPVSDQTEEQSGSQSYQRNFGRSLLAGVSQHYLSDFVLHGTSDKNFNASLHQDLTMSVQNSVLDEQISEAVCIVADIDNWTVKLQKCQYDTADRVKTQEVAPSPIICNIIESVHNLWKLKMSPEFCLMHLEDRLQEVFFKSRTLAEFLRLQKRIDMRQLATTLKMDVNDIPLLLAVAGTHTPLISMALQ